MIFISARSELGLSEWKAYTLTTISEIPWVDVVGRCDNTDWHPHSVGRCLRSIWEPSKCQSTWCWTCPEANSISGKGMRQSALHHTWVCVPWSLELTLQCQPPSSSLFSSHALPIEYSLTAWLTFLFDWLGFTSFTTNKSNTVTSVQW